MIIKQTVLFFNFTCLLMLLFIACPAAVPANEDDDNGSEKKVISSWTGSFSSNVGSISGKITSMILYDDNSFTGQWTINKGSSVTLGNYNGTYAPNANETIAQGSGIAKYGTDQSNFTLQIKGNFSAATESGSYLIAFENTNWTSDAGNWTATKK